MKTTFDQITILFDLIKGSSIKTAISGDIYKMTRPTASMLEDVVINSLPITSDQIQRGTANVNIYVPDLKIRVDGNEQTMPDTTRMAILAGMASWLLIDHYRGNYAFWLTNQSTIAEPDFSHHYINLRVDFQFFPTL